MAKRKAKVLPLTAADINGLARDIRRADIEELQEALGIPIRYALEQCLVGSLKASKIVAGGKIVAIFGDAVHDVMGSVGVPWLISTIHVERHAREFLRVCQPAVREMLERHAHLRNYVDVRNHHAVRWLKWLGFQFGEPVPYGPHRMPFYPFHLNREV